MIKPFGYTHELDVAKIQKDAEFDCLVSGALDKGLGITVPVFTLDQVMEIALDAYYEGADAGPNFYSFPKSKIKAELDAIAAQAAQ